MTDDTPDSLRAEAQQDDEAAEQHAEDNPTYAGYLERRAAWKRYLADRAEEDVTAPE